MIAGSVWIHVATTQDPVSVSEGTVHGCQVARERHSAPRGHRRLLQVSLKFIPELRSSICRPSLRNCRHRVKVLTSSTLRLLLRFHVASDLIHLTAFKHAALMVHTPDPKIKSQPCFVSEAQWIIVPWLFDFWCAAATCRPREHAQGAPSIDSRDHAEVDIVSLLHMNRLMQDCVKKIKDAELIVQAHDRRQNPSLGISHLF